MLSHIYPQIQFKRKKKSCLMRLCPSNTQQESLDNRNYLHSLSSDMHKQVPQYMLDLADLHCIKEWHYMILSNYCIIRMIGPTSPSKRWLVDICTSYLLSRKSTHYHISTCNRRCKRQPNSQIGQHMSLKQYSKKMLLSLVR